MQTSLVSQTESDSEYKMHFYKLPFLIFSGIVLTANSALLKSHFILPLGFAELKSKLLCVHLALCSDCSYAIDLNYCQT